jgi:hypothetical protein
MTPASTRVVPTRTGMAGCYCSLSGSFLGPFSKALCEDCDTQRALWLEMPGRASKVYKGPECPTATPANVPNLIRTFSHIHKFQCSDLSVTSLFFKNQITVLTP